MTSYQARPMCTKKGVKLKFYLKNEKKKISSRYAIDDPLLMTQSQLARRNSIFFGNETPNGLG